MSNIEKLKFHVLEMNGNNYLLWCLNIKLHLQMQGFDGVLVEKGKADEKDQTNTLIFIRCHLPESLKNQYQSIRELLTSWNRLMERFDHRKIVILSQAQYA